MMNLVTALDQPELEISIGGRIYYFSELPLACRARLQSWIQSKTPHPMEAVKAHVEGLDTDDRQYLLNEARKEAQDWPPDIGSPRGKILLLGTDAGQAETLYVGLTVHQPDMTREAAHKLFRALEREAAYERRRAKSEGREPAGENAIQRIYACMFGLILPSDEEGLPKKDQAPTTNGASTGDLSFVDVNKSSECASGRSDGTP
jgi:hypothetical protein